MDEERERGRGGERGTKREREGKTGRGRKGERGRETEREGGRGKKERERGWGRPSITEKKMFSLLIKGEDSRQANGSKMPT